MTYDITVPKKYKKDSSLKRAYIQGRRDQWKEDNSGVLDEIESESRVS